MLHRRAGKDLWCWNVTLTAAMERVGLYLYLLPQTNQARKVIWNGMDGTGRRFLDYLPKQLIRRVNNMDMSLTLINGSIIQLTGSNNYNSLMGSNPVGIVFSEYALQDPRARQYLSPILAENGGWEIINTTPRGKNHAYDVYQHAMASPHDWFTQRLSVDDTRRSDGSPVITLADIERERKGGMADELIKQEFYCFPPDAQVFTINGNKDISAIRPGDTVLTHAGRWRNVKDTISREYDGNMIKIFSAGSREPIICTPEHPIRTYEKSTQTYSWTPAKDITKGMRLVYPKLSNACNFKPVSESLVKIIAWYITEGSCSKTGLQFTLSIDEDEDANEIISCLNDIGIKGKIYPNKAGGVQNIIVCSTDLVDFLTSSCGSHARNKRIPFNIIQGHEELLFQTMMKGDGCFHRSKNRPSLTSVYATISKNLAYQFQLLGNSVGYKMTITKTKGKEAEILGRRVVTQDKYDVRGTKQTDNNKTERTPLRRTKYGVSSLVRRVETIQYSGTVHNLSVSHDNTYVVAGRAVHNCDFSVGLVGAYYTKEIDAAEKEGRITHFDIDPRIPVYTFWDIGVHDATAIWWMQPKDGMLNMIYYYEACDQGIEHFIEKIEEVRAQFGFKYHTHYGPHDIANREWGGNARSRLNIAIQKGLTFNIVQATKIEDGIQSVRSLFSRCRFHVKHTAHGLECLREYRRKYDEVNKVFMTAPLHNWASNGADAFRYMAVKWNDLFTRPNSGPFQYVSGF